MKVLAIIVGLVVGGLVFLVVVDMHNDPTIWDVKDAGKP